MVWFFIYLVWMYYFLVIFNVYDWIMQYVIDFSVDIFLLFNSIIYFYKVVMEFKWMYEQMLLDLFFYVMIGVVGMCLVVIFLFMVIKWKFFFGCVIWMGLFEYVVVILIILFVGILYIGDLVDLDYGWFVVQIFFWLMNLECEVFFVRFWELFVEWVFILIILGVIIMIFFYFDYEISSIICIVDWYGVKKFGGYVWDIVLLGMIMVLCGILGILLVNGLLLQVLFYLEFLWYWVVDED